MSSAGVLLAINYYYRFFDFDATVHTLGEWGIRANGVGEIGLVA